jgi:hypothetical protein
MGEPLAALLRPGNAGSNTIADHLSVIRGALRQLSSSRAGQRLWLAPAGLDHHHPRGREIRAKALRIAFRCSSQLTRTLASLARANRGACLLSTNVD